MANWISSKLRAAETILQQIDQQAAESLRKNEKQIADELSLDTPTRAGGSVPLKDQLKKKTLENQISDYRGKLTSDPSLNIVSNNINVNDDGNKSNRDIDIGGVLKPRKTLTDGDWTQLLSSTPNRGTTSAANRGNGFPGVRGLRKDGRRQGSASSTSGLSVLEAKKNQKSGGNNVVKSTRRASVGEGSKLNGKVNDGEESGFSVSNSPERSSSVELKSDGKILEGRELDYKDVGLNTLEETEDKGNEQNGGRFDSKELSAEVSLQSVKKDDGGSNKKLGRENVDDRLRKLESIEASRSSTSEDLKRGFTSVSDGSSDSDTDTGSSSDSESEREKEERRKKREKILAEKAAAKAVEAIKERENMVARLEGEKQSLEKILEEQVKQQAQEASKLQMTMMETMEAADLEKQKHNNTRMEAFARLAKLETSNADLAKSLANVQWNLQVEANQVAELRQQIELKEVNQEELRRKISDTHQTKLSLKKVAASKGIELEREILEAEYAFVTDKIVRLQDKAQELEANIEMTRKEIEDPTEIEIELKRRLAQMTDHLIHKQAQVEALSSEKATLLFRIEAVSRSLDESKSLTEFSAASSRDIESGRPLFEDRIRSGRKHLGSALQQLESIFLAGVVFLRRNPTVKIWAAIYFVCLHLWVIYILMSRSQASNEMKSGAVISLENINNTAGV
ncbi:golgin candidate 2 [Pyrus x bretschneideri]|uniref:golgin candidate 2 n=1 Tax=Pyrus x bretschneideri TaxID=225117 RepID=UPI00202E9C49|nr:golgin candidate 2 [Pyrus x bretschneideri]